MWGGAGVCISRTCCCIWGYRSWKDWMNRSSGKAMFLGLRFDTGGSRTGGILQHGHPSHSARSRAARGGS